MITFVVYTAKKEEHDIYADAIRKLLFPSSDRYEIALFSEDSTNLLERIKHIDGSKIFILDVDITSTLSGITVARKIRHNGDFTSPIILLSSNKEMITLDCLKNVLYLDVVSKKSIDRELSVALHNAFKIITRYSVLSFSIFDELYRLPYDEICYIEKNVHTDCVTIYTLDDTYQNYISIKILADKLKDDPRFFKSHRSCIINIYNVVSFDKRSNKITFKNGLSTCLVARSKKRMLINKLNNISDDVKVKE